MASFLFERDGASVVPSELTVGPWSAAAQHGGPVSALLAGAIEATPAPGGTGGPDDMAVVRVTVELLRPVPVPAQEPRLVVPVIAGEPSTPLPRVAALADFGNGISRIVNSDTHRFINPDLTVSLGRSPEGEWIGFDAVSRLGPDGFGQAESLVFDRAGPVGRSIQSLIVETVDGTTS